MPAAKDSAGTTAGGEAGRHEPKMKQACDECYRKKVKCSQEKPMCLKCRENGTYCKYSPTQRKGKRKAEPTARHNDQVPAHLTGNPGYFSHGTEAFWQHNPELVFGYDPNQDPGLDIAAYAGLDMSTMPPGSVPSGSSSASPDMDYSLLHLDQDTIFFDVDTSVDHTIYDQYRHLGHSRSNSFDTATTMSRTNSLQAARDVQQMYDLHQTPSSTPPGTGTNAPSFFPGQQPHMDSATVDGLYNDQQSSMAGTGLQSGKTCNCFMNCQTYLDALRKMDGSNVLEVLQLSDTAMQSCSCLLLCPNCRRSIGADTVSVIASIIDKVSSLYKHLFTGINKEFASSGARPKMQQVVLQHVAILRDLHLSFIEMCYNLPEAHAIAAAWIDRVNAQMGWIDGLHLGSAQTSHGGNFTGDNTMHLNHHLV